MEYNNIRRPNNTSRLLYNPESGLSGILLGSQSRIPGSPAAGCASLSDRAPGINSIIGIETVTFGNAYRYG